MGYDATNGIIKKPVGIYDLQQCFGVSETDLGTIINKIFNDGIINKWARFKPIPKQTVEPLDTGNSVRGYYLNNITVANATGITSTLHCNASNIFGISTVGWNSQTVGTFVSEALTLLTASNSKFRYKMYGLERPTGGAASPYRLTDFALMNNTNIGYCKNAVLGFSYHDSSYNWYNTTPFYNAGDETDTTRTIKLPTADTTIEPTSAIQSCWENYELNNQGKTVSQMTVNGCNVRVQDLLVQHSSASNLKNMRHGIVYFDLDGNGNHYVFVDKLPFGQSTSTMNTVRSNMSSRLSAYLEFYTTAPATSSAPMSLTDSNVYTWIPIPLCCSNMQVAASSTDGGFTVYSGGIWWPSENAYMFEVLPQVQDFSAWREVRIVIGEFNTTTTSSIQRTITDNTIQTIYDYGGSDGQEGYINLVGTNWNGSYKIMNSERFVLSGKGS